MLCYIEFIISSSCIDLIFTSQANILIKSGVHLFLHSNCHHQIVFTKYGLKIFYPSLYFRHVWHYREANTDLSKHEMNNLNWEKAFFNTNLNEKVSLFNKMVLNILNNYNLHETINSRIKSLIEKKE